eukprot:jgi/Astpho2/9066/Aster-x0381
MTEQDAQTAQAVVQSITDDGTLDDLRVQLTKQLKQHAELRQYMEDLVQDSDVFQEGRADQMSKKALMDAVKSDKERCRDMLEMASEVAQDIVTQPQYGMEQQIHQHCRRALQTAQQGQQSRPR